jgi:hypothetical protein
MSSHNYPVAPQIYLFTTQLPVIEAVNLFDIEQNRVISRIQRGYTHEA